MNTNYNEIIKCLDDIKVSDYSKDRNFIDGSVTRFSPYISRGLITTNQIYKHLVNVGYKWFEIEKYIQQLAWRDYWQLIWLENDIDKDLKRKQENVIQYFTPKCVIEHNTKIKAIDLAIKDLYKYGFIHNHLRLYIASLVTNIAKSHWLNSARWMYYHLLDADWASNALSWQWVAGTNSHKKYYMNQDNINKYTKTIQKDTVIDLPYEDIINLKQPTTYSIYKDLNLKTKLPKSNYNLYENKKPILIYNFYNLDVNWRKDLDADRVLLLEPSKFKKYPISNNSMNFFIELSKNVQEIKIYVGEFDDIEKLNREVYYKQHPLNHNYNGIEDSRDWLTSTKGYYPSFFKYWNVAKKELKF